MTHKSLLWRLARLEEEDRNLPEATKMFQQVA
eukprot:COSAG05_NODE_24430_length_251_cov_1.013158_1_plen_31_part_10